MIHTEKYMAFRRPEFREANPGFDTIGEVLYCEPDGVTAMISENSPEHFPFDDVLPIGEDDVRAEFGLRPFKDVWPDNAERSSVTRDRVWCFLPGPHYRRPGFVLPVGQTVPVCHHSSGADSLFADPVIVIPAQAGIQNPPTLQQSAIRNQKSAISHENPTL